MRQVFYLSHRFIIFVVFNRKKHSNYDKYHILFAFCRNGTDVKRWKIKSSTDIENKATGLYFTFEQLKTLYELDLSQNERLDNARDWLIISIFTAVRVSELMKMKREDISKDNKGRDVIKVIEDKNRNKKGDGLKYLPLFDEVKDILIKRNGDFPCAISSQRYNDYIKEVCKVAGFNEMIESAVIAPRTETAKYRGNIHFIN